MTEISHVQSYGLPQLHRSKLVLRLVVAVAILGVWQWGGDDSKQLAFPTFTRTAAAFIDLVRDGSLAHGLLVTNQALLGGYALALAISLPLGVLMGRSNTAANVAGPYLTVLLATPMIAITPVIQIAFGLTLLTKVVIVFLFAFVYMTTNTMIGVRMADPSLREMAVSFGSSRRQMLREVVLPAAMPAIMAGIRLGLGRAVVGMIVAELTILGSGVGSMIINYQTRFDPAYVFAIILATVSEGVLLMEVAGKLERRLGHWKGSQAVE